MSAVTNSHDNIGRAINSTAAPMPRRWNVRIVSPSRWPARGSLNRFGKRSTTTTSSPSWASSAAQVIPTGPYPTIATSHVKRSGNALRPLPLGPNIADFLRVQGSLGPEAPVDRISHDYYGDIAPGL